MTGLLQDPNDPNNTNLPEPTQPPTVPRVPEVDDVGKITNDLLKQDSPLMQQAATKGRQFAHKRGLLNSSLAAGAAQAASIDAIRPLAQQQATQAFQKNISNQGFEQSGKLSDRDFREQTGLIRTQGDTTSKLSAQDFTQRGALADQDLALSLQIQEARDEDARALSAQQASQQSVLNNEGFANQLNLQQNDNEFKAFESRLSREKDFTLASWQLEANEARSAESMLSNIHLLHTETIKSVLANPDLTAQERASQIDAAAQNLAERTAMLESLFSIDINWSAPNSRTSSTAPQNPLNVAAPPNVSPPPPSGGGNNPGGRGQR